MKEGSLQRRTGKAGIWELSKAIRPKMQERWKEWPRPVMERSDRITSEMLEEIMGRCGIFSLKAPLYSITNAHS